MRLTKKERYRQVIEWFQTHMPVAETELHYSNPFELLVAVILSAQCTDKRVNMITPDLFNRYPDAATMATASAEEVLNYVKSISYPNNKAKHLVGMAQRLMENFNGEVPSDAKELESLPGVGRKTANVIQSVVFNKPAMAVDTHVFRVANRIGLTLARNPLQSEKELIAHIPAELLPIAHHWLILHGRYLCVARKPLCNTCGLSCCCKYFDKAQKNTFQPDK